jgi:hypothetical protein
VSTETSGPVVRPFATSDVLSGSPDAERLLTDVEREPAYAFLQESDRDDFIAAHAWFGCALVSS